jgi:hypothetical protein
LPRTTPQEGPELNAVPPPLAEGRPHEVEPTPTLDAAGTAVGVVSKVLTLPKLADTLSGETYKVPLGNFGRAVKGVYLGIKLGGGYYRDEGSGVARALDDMTDSTVATAILEVGAHAAAEVVGVSAAPVAAVGAVAYAIGTGIDLVAHDWITQKVGQGQDWTYGHYDHVFREPQREEMGRQLREKHQRTKAENATRATIAAQRAEAEQGTRASTPAVAQSTGPSVGELILQSLTQIQQFREAKAAAQGGGASPQAASRGCQIPANDQSGRVCTAN